jgi:hypothetical protein
MTRTMKNLMKRGTVNRAFFADDGVSEALSSSFFATALSPTGVLAAVSSLLSSEDAVSSSDADAANKVKGTNPPLSQRYLLDVVVVCTVALSSCGKLDANRVVLIDDRDDLIDCNEKDSDPPSKASRYITERSIIGRGCIIAFMVVR